VLAQGSQPLRVVLVLIPKESAPRRQPELHQSERGFEPILPGQLLAFLAATGVIADGDLI
jgi:hypothetical protein